MWSKVIKIAITLLPYVPRAVEFLLRKLNIKKLSIMEEKIKQVSEILDEKVDFGELSKGIKNVFVKGLVASVEMVDGSIIKFGLEKLINKVPDDKKVFVEKYLDAVIKKDWVAVADNTGSVVNVFVDVPGATEDQEEKAFAAALVLILMFIKEKVKK